MRSNNASQFVENHLLTVRLGDWIRPSALTHPNQEDDLSLGMLRNRIVSRPLASRSFSFAAVGVSLSDLVNLSELVQFLIRHTPADVLTDW